MVVKQIYDWNALRAAKIFEIEWNAADDDDDGGSSGDCMLRAIRGSAHARRCCSQRMRNAIKGSRKKIETSMEIRDSIIFPLAISNCETS